MKVLMILCIAIFGAIGLFTGGCSLVFLIGTEGTGGGYLDVQLMGLGIAAACGLLVYLFVRSWPAPHPEDDEQ